MPIFHRLERIAGQKTAKGIEPIISKALKYFFDQEMKDQQRIAGQKTAKNIEPIISKALKYFFDQEMKDQYFMATVVLPSALLRCTSCSLLSGLFLKGLPLFWCLKPLTVVYKPDSSGCRFFIRWNG